MTRMEWEKAAARDRQERANQPLYKAKRDARRDKTNEARRLAMAVFVDKHQLACFACGGTAPREWAKTGVSRRGPWALCAACRKKNKR